MKRFVLSLFALVCVTMSFAQSSLLATLSHDGNIKTFYGAKALIEAHSTAENGDVITLSSGSFIATNIEKALTIRGAGMEVDSINGTLPTILTGDFEINIPDTVSERLTLEGVYSNHTIRYSGTLNLPMFLKCRIKEINTYYNSNNCIVNASFIHCKITDRLSLEKNSSASCINSCVRRPYSHDDKTSNFEFINCVICYSGYVKSSLFNNSIIYSIDDGGEIYNSSTVYNCISVNNSNLFKWIPNTTNKVSTFEEIFKTFRGGDFNDNDSFELTDEAKKKFLGIDGAQVGIYGGMLPYDPTPSNPQIKKCNVAAKSTADGKLSVDIEVKAAE